MAKRKREPKKVEAFTHDDASRKNIPTAEYESVMREEDRSPIQVAYERRNRDLDPQLVWRGKDEQDWSDLVVQAPPLYIQEKVHPKVLIDDLMRRTEEHEKAGVLQQIDLFADFNGLPDEAARTEFYQHDANWTNRMILGDSLQVMASLAEREGLRGKVQCIYVDPPYGIRFNSNFQWSTTSRTVTDGKADHITREPEQVKAFRDTWRDGTHSYLTYLRDRLTACRDLLHDTGSIFIQIGDENVHLVRSLMDEVFGSGNFCATIAFKKTTSATSRLTASIVDSLVWYARNRANVKYNQLFTARAQHTLDTQYTWIQPRAGECRSLKAAEADSADALGRRFMPGNLLATRPRGPNDLAFFDFEGRRLSPRDRCWKTNAIGMRRLARSDRLLRIGNTLRYKNFADDYPVVEINALWEDTVISGFAAPRVYVVQTAPRVIERCVLMTSSPGDLVLDPTCGSGTTAYVAESWGRRWITIGVTPVSRTV